MGVPNSVCRTKESLINVVGDIDDNKDNHQDPDLERLNRKTELIANSIAINLIEEVKHPDLIDFDKELFFCWFDVKIADIGYETYDIELYLVDNEKLYMHTFNTSLRKIKTMYRSVNNTKNRKKYFAIKPFPTSIPSEDKFARNPELQNKMTQMQKFMTLDPDCLQSENIEPTDIEHILCQLFNSPLFVAEPKLYETFVVNGNMQTILQMLAAQRLAELEKIAKNKTGRNHKKLYTRKQYKNIQFKRLYLVQRENGPSTAHWALKFEGDTHLLSVDWFYDDRAYYQILENDTNGFGQRIFWYSHIDNVLFNSKWIELLRLDLTVSCGDIGHLIDEWIEEYEEYETYDNNCQHFARDILSAFHIDLAKNITQKSKKTFVAGSGAPVLQFSDMYQEIKRIDSMSNKLGNVLSDIAEQTQQARDWLSNTVNLEENYGIDVNSFIDNGFDTLSLCRYISRNDLEELGIDNVAHQRAIMHHVANI